MSAFVREPSRINRFFSLLPMLLLAFVVLAASGARAEEWQVPAKDRMRYVNLDKESGRWVLMVFEAKPGMIQDRVLFETYSDEDQARRRTEALLAAYGYVEEEGDQADFPSPIFAPPEQDMASELTGESIWKVTNSWSWEWEKAFSSWVQSQIDVKFFSRYGISTDCADVAVSLRWIFARMNGLPAANTLAGTKSLFTQASMKNAWKNLPQAKEWYKDQRFLTALEFLLDNTYTKSILWDGYPIAINKQTFIPGVWHLEFHSEGGHTMVVSEVKISGGGFFGGGGSASLRMIQSTLPQAVRDLIVSDYIHASQPARADGGFMRMRWPVANGDGWKLQAEDKHPDYSAEQYSPEFMAGSSAFSTAVKKHLTNKVDSYKEFQGGLQILWELMSTRVKTVEVGYAACKQIDCKPGTAGWEEHSTPGRDAKIRDKIKFVTGFLSESGPSQNKINQAWNQFINSAMVIEGQQVQIKYVINNFVENKASPDPRVSIAERWGF